MSAAVRGRCRGWPPALPGVELVVGVDPTWDQLTVARDRAGGAEYARAGAAALPFPTAAFDTVVACLVFEHIDEVDAAVAEVGRVLAPGGRFLLFLNHPLLQTPGSGWIDDRILDEQYWRIGPYLTEDTTLEQVDNGVWIPFVHRPLSRYVNALIAAGLLITAMEEPSPPPGFPARAHEYRVRRHHPAAAIPALGEACGRAAGARAGRGRAGTRSDRSYNVGSGLTWLP